MEVSPRGKGLVKGSVSGVSPTVGAFGPAVSDIGAVFWGVWVPEGREMVQCDCWLWMARRMVGVQRCILLCWVVDRPQTTHPQTPMAGEGGDAFFLWLGCGTGPITFSPFISICRRACQTCGMQTWAKYDGWSANCD